MTKSLSYFSAKIKKKNTQIKELSHSFCILQYPQSLDLYAEFINASEKFNR